MKFKKGRGIPQSWQLPAGRTLTHDTKYSHLHLQLSISCMNTMIIRPTFWQTEDFQNPHNRLTHCRLNPNRLAILMSGILSYGKLNIWALFERINCQMQLSRNTLDLRSHFLLGLETALLGSSAGTAGWHLFSAACMEQLLRSSVFSEFGKII